MFDHVEFSVTNVRSARQFYGPICAAIGAQEIFFDDEDKSVGYGIGDIVQLLLTEGQQTSPKLHICFTAQNKISVEQAYTSALSGGGMCNGKPGYRNHYGEGYYAAFAIDPDGHNIEFLFRDLNAVEDN